MNNKHLALVVIVVLIIFLVQGSLSMNNRMGKMQRDAEQAAQATAASANLLTVEQRQLSDLRNNSRELIDYLKLWQPYFDAFDSAQSAELKISLPIKQNNLVCLSQRYEVTSQKTPSLPSLLRAHLTFEDKYPLLLNWLGQTEAQLPTMRIASLRLTQGTSPDDVKMDLVLEQPLVKP